MQEPGTYPACAASPLWYHQRDCRTLGPVGTPTRALAEEKPSDHRRSVVYGVDVGVGVGVGAGMISCLFFRTFGASISSRMYA